MTIEETQARIAESSQWIQDLKKEMAQVLVGQDRLVERLLIGLLCNGHILLAGVPVLILLFHAFNLHLIYSLQIF
jgi:MoxR-like ATPase